MLFSVYFAHFYYSLRRCCLIAAVVTIDVILKSFIIVSTHRLRHVASETGFTQDSPNPNPDSDSLIECTLLLNPDSVSLYPNPDSLIEYRLSWCYPVRYKDCFILRVHRLYEWRLMSCLVLGLFHCIEKEFFTTKKQPQESCLIFYSIFMSRLCYEHEVCLSVRL